MAIVYGDLLCRPEFGLMLPLLLLVAALVVFRRRRGHRVEPPGPWGLPVVGYLPFLGRKMNLTINSLAQRYGDVFQLRLGSRKVVVISGQKSIRKALLENGTVFAGRPDFYTYNIIENFGFADFSPSFRVYKKNTMKAFAQFTNIRREELQQVAHNSLLVLMEKFKVAKNQPIDPKPILSRAICAIVGYICYGEFFDVDSEEVTTMMAQTVNFSKHVTYGVLCDYLPWTKFLTWKYLQALEKLLQLFRRYSDKMVSAHINGYDSKTMRDMSDMFRKVAENMDEDEKKVLNVNDRMLKSHISTIFGAGIGTTMETLRYAVMIMALNPDIQIRVQEEIDAVVGRDRFPEFGDEVNLPYTVATITEIYRYYSMSALGAIAHSTTCDTELSGYFIPKGTVVFFNLYSANYDETVFTDPKKFDPGRFLTDAGTFDKSKARFIVPFSLGQRRCAGESVARLEVFLFFTTILHQCTVEQAPGHPLDLNDYIMTLGITYNPFKVIFRSRNKDW